MPMIPASQLDPGVARLLTLLGTDDLEVERLIRMGATKPAHLRVEDALGRLGSTRSKWDHAHRGDAIPGPRHLLTWGRLLTTLSEWERGVPMSTVAIRHGWGGSAGIWKAMQRYAGISPTEWQRQDGTIEGLSDAFVRTWREGVKAGRAAA